MPRVGRIHTADPPRETVRAMMEPSTVPQPSRGRGLQQLALATGAGILMASPFWIEVLWPVMPLGLALWGLCVDPRLWRGWALGACAGIYVFVGIGAFWLWGFHPLAPFVLPAYFCLYALPMAWIYRRTVGAGAPAWLALPVVWVAGEQAVRLVTLFPSSWFNAGYTLLRSGPVAQSADVWGVAGLSFLVALAGGLLAEIGAGRLSKSSMRWKGGAQVLLLLSGAAWGYGSWRAERLEPCEEIRALIVQGNIPQQVKGDPLEESSIFQRHVALTFDGARDDLDLVVWPESSASVFPDRREGAVWKSTLAGIAERIDAPLMVGALGVGQDAEGRRTTNSIYLFSPGSAELERYDKVILVPFGEFIPFLEDLPADLVSGLKQWIRDRFGVFPYMLPGPGPHPLLVPGDPPFLAAGLVCYEDVLPAYTAESVRRGAQILVNPSNEAWYLHREMDQHLDIARMRCIENRRSMLRATNTGLSTAIDPRGRVIGRLLADGRDRDVAGTLLTDVPVCRELSLYTRFGPVFGRSLLVVACLGLLATFLPGLRPRRTPPASCGPPEEGAAREEEGARRPAGADSGGTEEEA